MDRANYRLGIIGTGNMAEAIIKGIAASKTFDPWDICAFEIKEDRISYIKEKYGIFFFPKLKDLIRNSGHIIISVKPLNVPELIEEIAPFIEPGRNSVISIAAGVSTGFIEKNLKKEISVVRIMPNTPAILNMGISAISPGRYSGKEEIDFAINLIKSVGDYIITDESFQNSITAISGSGPAYFFLFCRAMINTAVKMGIPEEIARKLVFETMEGSTAMLREFKGDTDYLIGMVKSPGGTTEAALNIFLKNNFDKIVSEALQGAEQRAGEIQNMLENKNSGGA
jgi:pyrroline-5-carboxylate reductase